MSIEIFVLFFGFVIGSFLNVVIFRSLSSKKKFWQGRSECLLCKKKLTFLELIPVFSYLFQKGKCTKCGGKISLQYIGVEIATGFLFVFVYSITKEYFSLLGVWYIPYLLSLLTFWSMAVIVFVFDMKTKLILDGFSFVSGGAGFFALLFLFLGGEKSAGDFFSSISAGFLLFSFFYILWKVSKGRWIGLGDGKYAIGIGFLLGMWGGISALIFSFWIGTFVVFTSLLLEKIFLLLQKKKKKICVWGREIPFGPFLVVATFFVFSTGFTLKTISGL
jgi:leader peptidase (prepilin peptidase) / N-methyltransferase